jgi:hypothetical protein
MSITRKLDISHVSRVEKRTSVKKEVRKDIKQSKFLWNKVNLYVPVLVVLSYFVGTKLRMKLYFLLLVYRDQDTQNFRPAVVRDIPKVSRWKRMFLTQTILIIIIIIGIQPLGRSGQRPEFSQATGTVLVRCILGRLLGVVCHCFPPRLDIPTFATRCPQVRHDSRDPSDGRWNCGREYCPVILPFRDLLHAANLRHGTDGFTSPPKEGVLRIFKGVI